jgi:hypothetical protein
MTDTSLDDLGPVDYLVVEFPAGASNFTGEMAAELLALVDSGTIRDDVERLAAAMEPNSTAGVLIWENLWAAPFASAARRSGGQLIATGRIPIQAIIASIAADNAPTSAGG